VRILLRAVIALDVAFLGYASLVGILFVFGTGAWGLLASTSVATALALGVASLRLRSRRRAIAAAGARVVVAVACAYPVMTLFAGGTVLLPVWLVAASPAYLAMAWRRQQPG